MRTHGISTRYGWFHHTKDNGALTSNPINQEHTVTLTGAQTGTVLTASVLVAEDPAAVPVPSAPADPAAGAAGSSGSGPGGVLGSTGAVVGPLAALAALLMAAGTMLALRHRWKLGQLA